MAITIQAVKRKDRFTVESSPVAVDFSTARSGSALTSLSFGSCISTFAGDGQNVNIIKGGASGTAWKAKLGELGPLVWRIPLAWNGGTPGSSAGGARSYGDADEYIQAIKDIGGIPMIAVGGTTGDNDITTSDAAALVDYFNAGGGQNGGPVDYWIIGNEPDNSGADAAYITAFNGIAAAMRAASPSTIYLAGPTLVEYADYKQGTFNSFLDTCGAQTDRLDFHKYGSGDGLVGNLAATAEYNDAVVWLNGAIAARSSTVGRVKVQCGELNYHPFYNSPTYGADAFWTSRNTCHTASAIGNLVNNGGSGYQYSDNNGPLGLISPGNANNGAPNGQRLPMPAFFGVKMWTGGNLFRRPTGSMATVTHSVSNLDVFASTGDKNIVVVNKDATQARSVVLGLTGASPTTCTIWQTAANLNGATVGSQFEEPTQIYSGSASSTITVTCPAMTVTTVLI